MGAGRTAQAHNAPDRAKSTCCALLAGVVLLVASSKADAEPAACESGDCDSGAGTLRLGDSRYAGEFRDGKFHGRGTYTYADGSIYTGDWRDDHWELSGRRYQRDHRPGRNGDRDLFRGERERHAEFAALLHDRGERERPADRRLSRHHHPAGRSRHAKHFTERHRRRRHLGRQRFARHLR